MRTLDFILSGETFESAIDFLEQFDFSECSENKENSPLSIHDYYFVKEHEGINMYYHWVADYYFFTYKN